jgi:hypothetical protein
MHCLDIKCACRPEDDTIVSKHIVCTGCNVIIIFNAAVFWTEICSMYEIVT